MITVEALSAVPGVSHGFFTRHGGGSAGIYTSNNCAFGSQDAAEIVERNRANCAALLGASPQNLVTVKQRHTPDVVTVDQPWRWNDAPVADALVTQRPGIAVGILTADCTPILMADGAAGVIAAAHAGWKGAFDGVIASTVDAMIKLGAQPGRIVAVLGPAIGRKSYEVGPEFIDRFRARDASFTRYFDPPKANGHTQFDLAAFVRDRLTDAGATQIHGGTWDTCAEEDQFFSYRRSVLRKEPDYGRQLSAIALKDAA